MTRNGNAGVTVDPGIPLKTSKNRDGATVEIHQEHCRPAHESG